MSVRSCDTMRRSTSPCTRLPVSVFPTSGPHTQWLDTCLIAVGYVSSMLDMSAAAQPGC